MSNFSLKPYMLAANFMPAPLRFTVSKNNNEKLLLFILPYFPKFLQFDPPNQNLFYNAWVTF